MRETPANLGRRDVIQRLAMSVGGIQALPLVSAGHPIHSHLVDDAVVGTADQKANSPDYTPEFLDSHQFQTLQMLAERIVPGSGEARSGAFIDQLLTVAVIDERK